MPKLLRLTNVVFILLCLCILEVYAQRTDTPQPQLERPQLFNLKIAPLNEGARLIATLNRRPDYHLMLLDKPTRLVIDLDNTDPAPSLKATKSDISEKADQKGIIRNLTYGSDGVNGMRIVIETGTPFQIADILVDPLHESIWQLVVDINPATAQDFAEKIALMQQNFTPKKAAQDVLNQQVSTEKSTTELHPFTLVLDAGHGGFDVGAEGVNGVLEKDITLAFAKELRSILAQENPDFSIHLTREKDVFLRLGERIKKAHDWHADLFISIHADSIHLPNVRGATVYTISDKASDALAKAIAENENKADLLDGLPPDEPKEVVDILLDLTRRETDILSTVFADNLVEHLSRAGIRLINPSHRHAGFMVLRAPEIPSVLVELGYLSNIQDEELIADPAWRTHTATTMAQAIKEYALVRNRQQP